MGEYDGDHSIVRDKSGEAWAAADRKFMWLALELARHSQRSGEVPVGAVVVLDGEVIGQGFNQPIATSDPSAHAEVVALRQAAKALGNYRLPGSTLYSTLEPCVMCAGALVIARVHRLVFAARDLRFGAVRSKFGLADSTLLNHRLQIEEGLLGTEATELLSQFFKNARKQ